MKNLLRNTIVILCAVFCATSISAQIGTKSHVAKTINFIFVNHKDIPIFVGPHSDDKEKSGLSGFTEIKPGASISLECFPDSVMGKIKPAAKLAFRLTNDPNNPSVGKNYMEVFSKVKTTIHIADKKIVADAFVFDRAKEFGIGFATDEMVDNTAACFLINKASVAITFTDRGHPFFGKTLAAKDSMSVSQTEKKKLVSTGFKDSKISIIMAEGDDPIKTAKTLPIFENSTTVVLTDEFFDLSIRGTSSKVYPLKLRADSPVDMTVEGAFDAKGRSTIYIIPGGPKGEGGKIVYVKYGENYLNLKYFYQDETSQPLIVRATERGTKYLKFQTSGPKKGKFIVDVVN